MNRRYACLFLAPLLLAGCRPAAPPRPPEPPKPVTQAPPEPPPPPARLWTKGTAEVPVIMYHDVTSRPTIWFDLTTSEFRRQMAALKAAKANVVTLDAIVEHYRDGKPLPERAIALTFDDGTLGNFTDALPILQEYGYPATFFVHTGYVGVPTSKEHMTWDQLREAEQTGLISVQPHTVNHHEFTNRLAPDQVRKELADSQAAIERELKHPGVHLAYPYGNGDEPMAQVLEELGYVSAWGEERAWCVSPADRFFLPRFAPKRVMEVIAHWGEPDQPRQNLAGPVELVAPGESQPAEFAVGDTKLRLHWGPPTLEGYAGGDRLPAGADLTLACEHVFLAGSTERELPDARQFGRLGRPVVAGSARQVAFAPFGPWMNKSMDVPRGRAPFDLLTPEADYAALGRAWLVHEGQAVAESERLSSPAVVAVTKDGQLLWGKAGSSVSASDLSAALLKLGATEAIVLS
jgi:peptidoglycan/xylan/chitin deacetylase (PgdA/CDA1 family)